MEEYVNRKTIEESARRYERNLQEAYNDVDKSHLRKMQKNMYICAANCCDNSSKSYSDVQDCVDNCVAPLNQAQQYMKNEFQDFQERVQRCLTQCNDEIRNKMDLEKSNTLTEKYKLDFENCANSCLTRYSEMLPSVIMKIKNTLDSKSVV